MSLLGPLLGEDPLGLNLSSADIVGGRTGRRKAAKLKPLTPEEQKREEKNALGIGLGGLQYVGETLDKPGRAVRGFLAGKPEELANLIPFSDTLGITDKNGYFPDQLGITNKENAVSGRQLLEHHGLVGANTDQGWIPDAGDLAGFGAEILTDPTTYLTLGASAVTKAGKLAKMAGISTKGLNRYRTLAEAAQLASPVQRKALEEGLAKAGTSLAQMGGEKLGGLFGLNAGPFGMIAGGGKNWVPKIAQGDLAEGISKAIGSVTGLPGKIPLPNGTTVGHAYDALLGDYAVKGHMNPLAQDLARAQTHGLEDALPGVRGQWHDILQPMQEVRDALHQSFGKHLGDDATDELTQRLARMVAEGKDPQEAANFLNKSPMFQSYIGNMNLPAGVPDKLKAVSGPWKNIMDKHFDEALDMGLDSQKMLQGEATQQSARYASNAARRTDYANPAREFRTKFGSALGRTEATKYLPADAIDAIYKDGDVLADVKRVINNNANPAFQVPGNVSPVDMLKNTLNKKYGNFIQDAGKTLDTTVNPYVGSLNGANEIMEGLTNHLIEDHKGLAKSVRSGANRYDTNWDKAQLKYATDVTTAKANMHAIHDTISNNLLPQGGIPLADVFKAANMDPERAMNYFAKKYGPQAAGMTVDPAIATAIGSVSQRVKVPAWRQFVNDTVDTVNGFWKKHVTLPFPSFWSRNFVGGQAMNAMMGDIPTLKDGGKYVAELHAANQVAKNPGQYPDKIREWLAHGLISPELAARELDVTGISTPIMPGALGSPKSWWQAIKDAGGAGADAYRSVTGPAGVRQLVGATKATATTSTSFGARASAMVEFMNRVPMYEYLKKQGYSAAEAAKRVDLLQVNYGHFTPFEKEFLKRAAPFYSYTRKTIPLMLQNLTEKPGGALAQVIRASNIGRSSDEFIPGYIGEGMSIPLGESQYISQLGLPTDQLGELFATGPTTYGTVKRSAQKLMGYTAPWIKSPVELATGHDLFTGKPLEDTYRYPTGSILPDRLIAALPTSRYVGTISKATDERKEPWVRGLNLLTGVKVSDIPGGVEKQKEYAAKALLSEIARTDPRVGQVTDLYVKGGQTLEPGSRAETAMRALRGIANRQAKESRKKKKQAKANTGD